ncbi:MAG: hypothetical protein M1826_002811 [Phylliscum demangeonii]|nr:MAG: hypothetical protein M1826_002811 [Phylliscum demangeonii]
MAADKNAEASSHELGAGAASVINEGGVPPSNRTGAMEPEDGQKRNETGMLRARLCMSQNIQGSSGVRLDISVVRTRSLLRPRKSEDDSKGEEQRADGEHRNDPDPILRSPHPTLPNAMTMTAKTETDVAIEDNKWAFGWDVRKWIRATCNAALVRQKIMQTDFTDQASAKILSGYLQRYTSVYVADISLGTYRGKKYELIPKGRINVLLDEVEQREGKETLLDDLASECFAPKAKVETQPTRRKESLGSSRSTKRNKAARAVLCATLSHPFFALGRLAATAEKADSLPQPLDYDVVVSLHDFSLWIVYHAWDDRYYPDDLPYDPSNDDPEEEKSGPFRPDFDPSWAQLPGRPGKTLMARLASNIYQWDFDGAKEREWAMDLTWERNAVVPVFICAQTGKDGRVYAPV